MAVSQSAHQKLIHRYRGQAPSHIGLLLSQTSPCHLFLRSILFFPFCTDSPVVARKKPRYKD